MVPFERTFVTSYRLSIVTFPLSLRVSEILPLLCCSTPLFPTPPLVSPKFHHLPLGVGGWPLGYEERRCWAKCARFATYVMLIHQCHRQTDRQTDGRHAILIPRYALVHRAVKTNWRNATSALFRDRHIRHVDRTTGIT